MSFSLWFWSRLSEDSTWMLQWNWFASDCQQLRAHLTNCNMYKYVITCLSVSPKYVLHSDYWRRLHQNQRITENAKVGSLLCRDSKDHFQIWCIRIKGNISVTAAITDMMAEEESTCTSTSDGSNCCQRWRSRLRRQILTHNSFISQIKCMFLEDTSKRFQSQSCVLSMKPQILVFFSDFEPSRWLVSTTGWHCHLEGTFLESKSLLSQTEMLCIK